MIKKLKLFLKENKISKKDYFNFALALCFICTEQPKPKTMTEEIWQVSNRWVALFPDFSVFTITKTTYFTIYRDILKQDGLWWWLELTEGDGCGTEAKNAIEFNKMFRVQLFKIRENNPFSIKFDSNIFENTFKKTEATSAFLNEIQTRSLRNITPALWEGLVNKRYYNITI